MASLSRMSLRARIAAKFVASCAKEAKTPYFLCGANALLARNVIDRHTEDVDIYIAPRSTLTIRKITEPKLQGNLKEAVLVDGLTKEIKDTKTKFRIFKYVNIPGMAQPLNNMKVDVSENISLQIPGAFTEVDGINVATVPFMIISKTCAIASKNRGSDKSLTDINDLNLALKHLVANHEIVSKELQALFQKNLPTFTWKAFWDAYNSTVLEKDDTLKLEDLFRRVHIQPKD